MNIKHILTLPVMVAAIGCGNPSKYQSYADYPSFSTEWVEMEYTPQSTNFMLWAPTADAVKVNIYDNGLDSLPIRSVDMLKKNGGQWIVTVHEDLHGKFYTFNVQIDGRWLGDTPGVMAKAVGVNGKRAAIINFDDTDPDGWADDKRPELKNFNDIILYEMHHRDFSVDSLSGIKNKGKFLALTEEGTKNIYGQTTGLDHLKELGITHVHILPSYDYASVDETKLDTPQYNWGYDPQNYNVPDGSYSTDPYKPEVRIREFKQMVQSLHKAGIRVIMDVVYNHTFNTDNSNFQLTVPGYFYRFNDDGTFANGSGCGNETASDREMVRKYIVESVKYWVNEYHVDGFRFDLMGIHDIETMKAIRTELDKIDPSIFIYGEGWAAGSPKYPFEKLAMKANTWQMPGVAAFSDEFRDSLRGSWSDDTKGAFVTNGKGHEAGVMFGIAAALPHQQLKEVRKDMPQSWTAQPSQMISYISCHDDHCIGDRLKITAPDADVKQRMRLLKLAETAVFTSQGVPFIFTGDEIMRDKKGVKNSYCSPDSINVIDWRLKKEHQDSYEYIRGLIALRKAHPAFRLGSAEKVYEHLEFINPSAKGVVAFRIKGQPEGEAWKDITVILNATKKNAKVEVPEGTYRVVCHDGEINPEKGLSDVKGKTLVVAPQSATIAYMK
ncbi:type I pullulanase [Bacteroides sp.]|uniref:type I pullulanase n=1 Tax=Bacteroides sp. TaxID=29523 RepID=UPI0025C720E7|nr:type I pullulanase [Bacteroides sp.]